MMDASFPAPYMSGQTVFGFEAWLQRATQDLYEGSRERVREHIYEMVSNQMDSEGLTERQAVQNLGDPATAAKRFAKQYLTERDVKQITNTYGPKFYRVPVRIYVYLTLTAFIFVGAFFEERFRGPLLSVGFMCFALYLASSSIAHHLAKQIQTSDPVSARRAFRQKAHALHLIAVIATLVMALSYQRSIDHWAAILPILIAVAPALYQFVAEYNRQYRNIDDCIEIIKHAWDDEA